MVANFGLFEELDSDLELSEEFDFEAKLTDDSFNLSAKENRARLEQIDVDHLISSERGGESNQTQASDNEGAISSLDAKFVCSCSQCCDTGVPKFDHLVLGNASDLGAAGRSSDIKTNVPKTGDIRIDSLFYSYKWTNPTITYSFFDGGSYYGKERGVKEITGKMKSYIRDILENIIEPLINVDFVEVSDQGKNYGQLRYMFSNNPSSAYTKSMSNGSPLAGDVHFNPKLTKDFEKGPGAYRYETLIHETLHALGLKHPGNYNSAGSQKGPFLPHPQDNSAYSILSYNRLKTLGHGAITPMTYDILTLQHLYGAKSHNTGNTTYKFDTIYGYSIGNDFFGSKHGKIKQTIWDSSGKHDTLDFSQMVAHGKGYHIDLKEGGWLTTQDAYMSTSYKAYDNHKTYKTTSFGTSLAYNMTIENVVNSSSNDYIMLNQAANTISGYEAGKKVGNDLIIDANGKDTLDLSSYNSSAVKQTTHGNDLVIDLGSDGSITIKDYKSTSQGQRIKILWSDSNSPIDPPIGNTVETSFQQWVNNYNGAVDTYINSGSAKKHGSAQTLRVDGQTKTGHIDQTLLRFDDIFGQGAGQIAPNAQIQSATLQLNAINGGDRLQLHRMLTNWSGADTWGSLGNGIQADGQEAATNAEVITGVVGVGLLSFDVTASLKAWLANPSSNYGWALLPTGTDGVNFNSSEAAVAPKLIVKYSSSSTLPTPSPPTPTPVGQTLMGTNGNDQLQGGASDDLIRGHHGNDSITGLVGNDTIYGGEGIDTIVGGAGNDLISGGQSGDILSGGAGSDTFAYRYIGHGGDTITDFDVNNDKFDVSDIFASSKYGSANVFNDYIQVVGSSEGAKVKLDLLGDSGDQFQTLATLQGVDVNSLNASHFIV